MGERWFSDEELREMSRPTMERAIEAIVLVAHELGPLSALVTRSVVMHDGRVGYDGAPVDAFTDVHAHAHHPVRPPADHHPQMRTPFDERQGGRP